MTKVLAALDNSLAAKPVLQTAVALGGLLDAEVDPVHVPVDGDRVARATAAAEGLALRIVTGPVAQRLLEEGRQDEVVAAVVGARGTPAGPKPLGHTALALATSLPKPVVVVPPDIRRPGKLRRVLAPVEGGVELTPTAIIELARGADLDVVVLHVLEEAALPAFTDQPQHEQGAWAREFLLRYCPWGIGSARLEVRVGRAEDLVAPVAHETDSDIIALGWTQEVAEHRAPVVRAVLARAQVPVMLVPVQLSRTAADQAQREEEAWNSLRLSRA